MFIALTLALQLGAPLSDEDKNLIALARAAVISEVERKPFAASKTESDARAVFITIESNGKVRGCRGALSPMTPHLESEVVQFAKAAAAHDPRYQPLTSQDVKSFLVTVTVVDSVQPIQNIDGLSPADGLVLSSGTRKGIVLPYEGRDPQTRLQWAYKKAGVPEGSSVQLFKMSARRCRG